MTRVLVGVAVLVLTSACAMGPSPGGPAAGSAAARLPVLLVADGTAIDAEATHEIASALSDHIGRPVVTAHEPALDEAAERARLGGIYGRIAQRGWDEPRCAIGRAAAHALRYDTDAYYHLHLDRADAAREASAEERAAVPGTRRATAAALRRLGLAAQGSVHTVALSGTLTVATFGPTPELRSVPVRASVQEVDPLGRVKVDVRSIAATAMAPLAPPPFPHWNVLARRQLAAGCRLTALAVYEARLNSRADSRDVLDLALGRRPKRAAQPRVATAPVAPNPPLDAPAGEARYTCRSLCEMHMVELCNNDRDLWNRHQQLWESTPCGQRRSEPFLLDCYQRQWLSGTFDEACIRPCERAADGRARLLHMLQSGGCARVTSL